jgi:choice-of-anchor B domain-containing protein
MPFRQINFYLMRHFYLLIALLSSGSLWSQDKLNMTLLGQWDEEGLPLASGQYKFNDIWGYSDCEGREYAIMGSARFIHFLDVTEPADIREVARFPGSVNSIWRDFKTYGQYAYAVADQGADGLMVFDLSGLPDTVVLANQMTNVFQRSHNLYIDQPRGRLYLAGANTRSNGTIILDLAADPVAPPVLADVLLPGGYIHDIHLRDNIGYCSHGFNGLAIYDFTNPQQLVTLGTYTTYPEQGYNHSSWLTEDGSKLVFADETHGRSLKLVDVSDPVEVTLLSLFKSQLLGPEFPNSIVHNPFVRGDYAFLSYYHDGMQVFDLSDPLNVERAAYYDTYPQAENYNGFNGCWGVYPFLPSGNIIASDITNGLFVLKLDSIELTPPSPVDASLEVFAAPLLCTGDTAVLAARHPALYTAYRWMKDGTLLPDTGPVLYATQSGAYALIAFDGGCRDTSALIELVFAPLPAAELPVDTLVSLCESVEPLLIATPSLGDWYAWYQGGELVQEGPAAELAIAQSGSYRVEVSLGGCSAWSEVLEAVIALLPQADGFDLEWPEPACLGVDTIRLLLPAIPGQGYALALDGSPLDTLQTTSHAITANGLYQLTFFNESCALEIGLFLEQAFSEPIIPTVELLGDTLLAVSSATSYQWYLNGEPIPGADGPTQPVQATGDYWVEVVDANGCPAVSEPVYAELLVAATEPQTPGLKLYPNPARSWLIVEAPAPLEAVRLFDAQGRLVQAVPGQGHPALEISLSGLPAGVYQVQVRSQERSWSQRVVVW